MITIQNISPDDSPRYGEDKYILKINHKIICKFSHTRSVDGLAACLRDAADAVDKVRLEELADLCR